MPCNSEVISSAHLNDLHVYESCLYYMYPLLTGQRLLGQLGSFNFPQR
jgi:hypothetical protein